jgi:hypothetical protein
MAGSCATALSIHFLIGVISSVCIGVHFPPQKTRLEHNGKKHPFHHPTRHRGVGARRHPGD